MLTDSKLGCDNEWNWKISRANIQALIESRVIVASTNFYVLQITRYRYEIEKKKKKNGKELRIKVTSWSVIGATKGIVKSN